MRRLAIAAAALAMLSLLAGCQAITSALDPTSVVPGPVVEITATPGAVEPLQEAPPGADPVTGTQSAQPTPAPLALADAPATTTYTLPLVTRHVTETSAVLDFELDAPAQGVLLYWSTDAPDQQSWVELAPDPTRRQITLEGLLPGTRYQAMVALGPEPDSGLYQQVTFLEQLWDPVSFQTASSEGPLRIGVIGDSGFGKQPTFDLVSAMAAYNPDFVLHTGDLVYRMVEDPNPYESYAFKWYLPFQPILRQAPVYPVVGNHDVEAAVQWEGQPFYYHVFPPFPDPRFSPSDLAGQNKWYAFAYQDIQFLMLDTQTFFGETGRFEQEVWLAERLADDRFRYTIPVFHVPPYTSGRHMSDSLPVQSWARLFEESNVPFVLSGHDHNYQRLIVNGITYVVSGGGSAVLYPQAEEVLPDSIIFAQRSHFVLLDVYTDRIELQAITQDGEVIDQATIPLG